MSGRTQPATDVAIKLRIPRGKNNTGTHRGFRDPVLRFALGAFAILALSFIAFFSYFYVKYDRIIEARFKGPVFANAAKIYAQPQTIAVGEKIELKEIAADLRHAGYSEKSGESPMGSYRLSGGTLEIQPGPSSYHSPESATIHVHQGKIDGISGSSGDHLDAYELEPQMITSLFEGDQRSKRQVVHYNEIPGVMVSAVLAIEDRRFFEHSGVNFGRFAQAAWIDVTRQRHEQGGSTITMQLARGFFLTPQKTIKRKLTEMLIATELEQKFAKQQIFEFYALLAGIIQGPSYLSPYRHPERATERRNVVLDSMVETRAITREQAEKARATPLKLAPPNVEANDAPYFVDLVRDTVISKMPEREINEQAYRIYTTLDPDLQRAAAQAVEAGIKLVDDQVTKRRTKRVRIGKGKYETKVEKGPDPQVALIAMDPHTGDILALVGGRNYAWSQLDHAVAKRPTGSIFKPFVYAAAVNTALDGSPQVLTPSSIVPDEPSTFAYGDQIYEPRNYKEEYHGDVTARYALAMSLNNATVKLAEEVGYDKVADLAKSAGITSVKATPAMALGSYDATPLDMAAAYTVFANNGLRISPLMVKSVRTASGDPVTNFTPESRQVLDPRVSYVMTDMMAGVINNGLGYSAVRVRGFQQPAAGKTGSSHDGWFAGYTSNLLCIVWVGFDDYSDLHLSGAQTAAPIWTEFMKKAALVPRYSDMQNFSQPSGVVDVQLDKLTNLIATPSCPQTYSSAFIVGTEPTSTCDQNAGVKGVLSRIFGLGNEQVQPPANGQPADGGQKKKGLFGKIAGIFKDDKQSSGSKPQTQPQTPSH
ncbi:MAG: penicillin-binding protein [Acidobacteria bacterium]|nr:MAG: penicillin-binding protein [Acidobacteriota bacterium]